jgi:hypothetical protein
MKIETLSVIGLLLETLSAEEKQEVLQKFGTAETRAPLVANGGPLLTLAHAAREIGVSRWTLKRSLQETPLEEIPREARPVRVNRRPMFNQAFVNWRRSVPAVYPARAA